MIVIKKIVKVRNDRKTPEMFIVTASTDTLTRVFVFSINKIMDVEDSLDFDVELLAYYSDRRQRDVDNISIPNTISSDKLYDLSNILTEYVGYAGNEYIFEECKNQENRNYYKTIQSEIDRWWSNNV